MPSTTDEVPGSDGPPIACTLGGAQMGERFSLMAEIGRRSLVDVEDRDDHAVLRFNGDAGTRECLEAIVAGEAQCCAFLDLELVPEFDGLKLTISGPQPARPVVADLVEAFSREVAS